jgi:hypothetical protein
LINIIQAESLRARRARSIPGDFAIWAAILAEMSEFAIMFIVFLAKVHNPELFYAGPTKLNINRCESFRCRKYTL